MLTWVIALVPWLIGTTIAYACLHVRVGSYLGSSSLMFSMGFFLGYALLILFTHIFLCLGLNPFSSSMLIPFIIISGLVYIKIYLADQNIKTFERTKDTLHCKPCTKTPPPAHLVLFFFSSAIAAACLLFVVTESWKRPAVAWDTVWYWSEYANQLIAYYTQKEPVFYTLGHRHPPPVVYLAAWGGYIASITSSSLIFFPWVFVSLAIAIASISISLAYSRNLLTAITGVLILITPPIIDTHNSLAGYADIWLGAGVAATATWLMAVKNTQSQNSYGYYVLGALYLALISSLKLTGILIAISAVSALLLANKPRTSFLCALIIIFLIILLNYLSPSTMQLITALLPINYSSHVDEHVFIQAWGNPTQTVITLLQGAGNVAYALIINSSYSLSAVLALFCYYTLAFKWASLDLYCKTIITWSLIYLVCLIFLQVISPEFMHYSRPTNDTSLTRALLPWHVITGLAAITIISASTSYSGAARG